MECLHLSQFKIWYIYIYMLILRGYMQHVVMSANICLFSNDCMIAQQIPPLPFSNPNDPTVSRATVDGDVYWDKRRKSKITGLRIIHYVYLHGLIMNKIVYSAIAISYLTTAMSVFLLTLLISYCSIITHWCIFSWRFIHISYMSQLCNLTELVTLDHGPTNYDHTLNF